MAKKVKINFQAVGENAEVEELFFKLCMGDKSIVNVLNKMHIYAMKLDLPFGV